MISALQQFIRRIGGRWRWGAAAAGFALLAVVHTWPLASDLGGLSRNDNADAILNTWIVSWVAHQLPRDPLHLFDGNIFHPSPNALVYSEPLVVPGVMAMPLRWLGASPVLAYNVLLLLGFALTGWAMYAVIARWTGDHAAGVLAGSLIAFNAHTMTRLPHLQAIHAEWFPLAIWALDRLLTGRRTRDAVWVGLFVLLLALTSGYLAVFVVFALGAATISRPGDWWGRHGAPALVRLTAAAAVTLVIATAMLWPYRQVRVQEDFRRPLRIVEMYAASPWSYLSTTARLHYRTWSHRVFGERTTEALFPGFVALALSGVALGVRRRTQTAGRRRMLVAIAAVGFVLSLGTMTPLYAWVYHVVPPMQGIRAAARFGYLVLFAVAALAGMGLAELRRRTSARWGAAIAVGALALSTVEALHAPLRYDRFDGIHPVYQIIAEDPDPVAVVDIPVFDGPFFARNAPYLLGATVHWKPLLNGYSGSRPATFDALAQTVNGFPARSSIERLRALGVRYVVLHQGNYRDAERGLSVAANALQRPGLELLADDGDVKLFRVRRVSPP